MGRQDSVRRQPSVRRQDSVREWVSPQDAGAIDPDAGLNNDHVGGPAGWARVDTGRARAGCSHGHCRS